jgi:hypothetical protein
MALVDQIDRGAGYVDTALAIENIVGTPLESYEDSADGRGIVDEYNLTFDTVVAGATANVTVETASPNNPYSGATFAIALDAATEYKDIIPGVTLIFSDAGGFLNTWEVTVFLGNYLGGFAASGSGAGVASAGVKHRVENTGAGSVSGSKATLKTLARWTKKVGRVFDTVRPQANDAVEKVTGGGSNRIEPYVFTISAVAGVDEDKTCSVSVDGVLFPADSLKDLATGDLQSGALVKAVSPANFYEVMSGDLEGLVFAIDAGVANGNTANVLIFENRYLQIAEDVAGIAGAYGVADVDLTESGEATGVITAGGLAFYWLRVLVPEGSSAESNPYQADVAFEALEGSPANWLA